MNKRTLYLIAFGLLTVWANCYSQQLQISQGIVVSQYEFENSQNQSIQGLKAGSGYSFLISVHKNSLVDSVRLKQVNVSKSLKFISLFNYDLGLNLF